MTFMYPEKSMQDYTADILEFLCTQYSSAWIIQVWRSTCWDTTSLTMRATRLSPPGKSHLLLQTWVVNGNPATERNVPSSSSCSQAVRAKRTSYIDHENRQNLWAVSVKQTLISYSTVASTRQVKQRGGGERSMLGVKQTPVNAQIVWIRSTYSCNKSWMSCIG